jgi:hypothetical protein
MFNLFPKKKTVDEILEDANLTPAWQWTPIQTPSMLQAQNEIIEQFLKENHDLKCENQKLKRDVHQPELCNEKIAELTKEVLQLRHLKQENAHLKFEWKIGVTAWKAQYDQEVVKNTKLKAALKSIEEDGTEEHNNAVKLREENTELKNGNKNWMSLYQEVVDKNNELIKEVLQLRHLKQENVELMERVNEIDNDVIRDLQDQLFTLKNDYAVLKAKFFKERDEYKDAFESMKKGYEQEAKSADRELEKRLELEKEPAYLNCACGDCYDKTKQYKQFQDDMYYQDAYAEKKQKEVEFNAEELLKRVTDYADSVTKEPTWEEAASDLALRVAKLEEQLKYTQKIICRK